MPGFGCSIVVPYPSKFLSQRDFRKFPSHGGRRAKRKTWEIHHHFPGARKQADGHVFGPLCGNRCVQTPIGLRTRFSHGIPTGNKRVTVPWPSPCLTWPFWTSLPPSSVSTCFILGLFGLYFKYAMHAVQSQTISDDVSNQLGPFGGVCFSDLEIFVRGRNLAHPFGRGPKNKQTSAVKSRPWQSDPVPAVGPSAGPQIQAVSS